VVQSSNAVEGCTQGNNRLCVKDFNSGTVYLIDTGANVSVIPRAKLNRNISKVINNSYKLYAGNDIEIETYGTVSLTLNLGFCRDFRWNFIVCNVKQPILGADFLGANNLIVDLAKRKLIDGLTNLDRCISVNHSIKPTISSIQRNNPFRDLLEKYADITKPINYKDVTCHGTFHHIETVGQPICARPRQLPPHRYGAVREKFRIMQQLGICRPSKSPWASPLHCVPKKDGRIRPCGDYRALNAVTKPDAYPFPRLQDFTYGLTGKCIFSKIDINRAYHNIPNYDAIRVIRIC
jgi:hypothetical protein